MRLAFFAPMKPPDDPVPSGDRTIARNLITALEHLGATVDLASRFRARDGRGDRSVQLRLLRAAERQVQTVTAQGQQAGWQAWITYHNYYKAPDLIGPAVSANLGIPYLLIEASRAKKRLTGAWAPYARAAEAATDAAAVVFYASNRDAQALRRDAPAGQHLCHLRPFLTELDYTYAPVQDSKMLSAGMMRKGDKLASYQIIADTLQHVKASEWTLEIAGDGPARSDVEALMAPFADRTRFLGALDASGLRGAFDRAGLFFWPGVNEALGMVYLEAQAAGRPIIAQDRPGMNEVLAPGDYPSVDAGPSGLAARIDDYLADPHKMKLDGDRAQSFIMENNAISLAMQTLSDGLRHVGLVR